MYLGQQARRWSFLLFRGPSDGGKVNTMVNARVFSGDELRFLRAGT
jgi:hypothetical protein